MPLRWRCASVALDGWFHAASTTITSRLERSKSVIKSRTHIIYMPRFHYADATIPLRSCRLRCVVVALLIRRRFRCVSFEQGQNKRRVMAIMPLPIRFCHGQHASVALLPLLLRFMPIWWHFLIYVEAVASGIWVKARHQYAASDTLLLRSRRFWCAVAASATIHADLAKISNRSRSGVQWNGGIKKPIVYVRMQLMES